MRMEIRCTRKWNHEIIDVYRAVGAEHTTVGAQERFDGRLVRQGQAQRGVAEEVGCRTRRWVRPFGLSCTERPRIAEQPEAANAA